MAAASASPKAFLAGKTCMIVNCSSTEKKEMLKGVIEYFEGRVTSEAGDLQPCLIICCGRLRSSPKELHDLLPNLQDKSACIVFEAWLHNSVRARRLLDSAAFSAVHIVPGPYRGKFQELSTGETAPQLALGTERRLPDLPVAPFSPPMAEATAGFAPRLPGVSYSATAAASAPLAGCVVAVAGFSDSTRPSKAQVTQALLRGGACILASAFTHLITHLLVYVPCPAVAIGVDGLVSHKLPAPSSSGACVAIENAKSLGTLVPICAADTPGAPPQNPQALAEAEAAERWYRQLGLLNAGAPSVYALTPLQDARSSTSLPDDLDSVEPKVSSALGDLTPADADTAAKGAFHQAGKKPLQSLVSENGFLVETLQGRVPTAEVQAEVQAPPLDAPNWIWRKSMSGCARAFLASAAGAAVVTARWLVRSLDEGQAMSEGDGVLAALGTATAIPCLHEVVTATDVVQVADEAGLVIPPGADQFHFLLQALRRANGYSLPSAPWHEQDASTGPQAATLYVMTTGFKASSDASPIAAAGHVSTVAVSLLEVSNAIQQVPFATQLGSAQELHVPASGRPKHAHDKRCSVLVVWGLGRVEKLCALLALGGWVVWPTMNDLQMLQSSLTQEAWREHLQEHEVCIQTCSARHFGRVFAGAPRAWRLHGRPAFRGWVFFALQGGASEAKGPPLDMLQRVLLAGSATVHVLKQSGEQAAVSSPPVPPFNPQDPLIAPSHKQAVEDESSRWPSGRVLLPQVIVLLNNPSSALDEFSQASLAAVQQAASAAGWPPSAVHAVPRGWALDYLTQESLPPFPQ